MKVFGARSSSESHYLVSSEATTISIPCRKSCRLQHYPSLYNTLLVVGVLPFLDVWLILDSGYA